MPKGYSQTEEESLAQTSPDSVLVGSVATGDTLMSDSTIVSDTLASPQKKKKRINRRASILFCC